MFDVNLFKRIAAKHNKEYFHQMIIQINHIYCFLKIIIEPKIKDSIPNYHFSSVEKFLNIIQNL